MSQYWLQIASGPDVTFHRDTPGPPYPHPSTGRARQEYRHTPRCCCLLIALHVASVTKAKLPGLSGLDLTPGRRRAMLRSNRESHSGVHLTSGVAFGYTASLRCTLTSSVSPSRLRGFAAGRLACVR